MLLQYQDLLFVLPFGQLWQELVAPLTTALPILASVNFFNFTRTFFFFLFNSFRTLCPPESSSSLHSASFWSTCSTQRRESIFLLLFLLFNILVLVLKPMLQNSDPRVERSHSDGSLASRVYASRLPLLSWVSWQSWTQKKTSPVTLGWDACAVCNRANNAVSCCTCYLNLLLSPEISIMNYF